MTGERFWFLMLLTVNALVALGYLVWFLLFRKDEDNRAQFWMYALVMVLCPLIGPLYFLFSFLKYRFVRFGDRDLSDVEFSKRKYSARLKADEERERNIVPIEEAILISDQEKKRANMLNILLGETGDTLSAIAVALDCDDSEVSHYAASFLQNKLDAFREHIRQMKQSIQEKKEQDEPYQEDILDLIAYMDHILQQNVLTRVEQKDYVGQMEELCQELYDSARYRLGAECYTSLFHLLMELRDYERAEMWAGRFLEQYPDQLKPYTLRMKLYFETEQTEKFLEVLVQLRASKVEIDNQTLELIRMIQC